MKNRPVHTRHSGPRRRFESSNFATKLPISAETFPDPRSVLPNGGREKNQKKNRRNTIAGVGRKYGNLPRQKHADRGGVSGLLGIDRTRNSGAVIRHGAIQVKKKNKKLISISVIRSLVVNITYAPRFQQQTELVLLNKASPLLMRPIFPNRRTDHLTLSFLRIDTFVLFCVHSPVLRVRRSYTRIVLRQVTGQSSTTYYSATDQ